jgi:hypothetical protein
MLLSEWLRQHPDALRQVGVRALEDAKQAGVPVAYLDPEYGDDIIREFPDGRRERVIRGKHGAVVAIPARV